MADVRSDGSAGGMIALVPANPRRFAVSGGDRAESMHLTLVFLGEDVSNLPEVQAEGLKAAGARIASQQGPNEARVTGHAVWNMDHAEDPAAVYEIQNSPVLDDLNRMACGASRDVLGMLLPKQHEPFRPHVTAGYGIGTEAMKTSGPVTFDRVRVALGTEITDYPLTGGETGDAIGYSEEGIAMAEETVDAAKTGEAEVTEKDGELELHWPCLVLEGMRTGDGRFIPYGSLGARGLPLPVAGQVTNDGGHKGAEVFGKITKLERREGPTVTSKETGEPFPKGTAVWEAWGVGDPESRPGTLAAKGYLIGNSADIADATVEDELADGKPQRSLVGGKIGGTTLVPIPAFADGFVEVNGQRLDAQPAVEPIAASAAWTEMDPEHPAPVVASAVAEVPPLKWFTDPKLSRLTPLTRDGRHVFGHIADWNREHTSFVGQRMFAPRSRSDYKWFNTGAFTASDLDGTHRTVAVGRLTIGGGHADTALTHREAVRLYDDAATAWAYVAAGEDQYGIWVNGVTAEDADEVTIRKAFAHPPSGDWRPIDGSLELVAAHCVNSAGIPVPRTRVASGTVVALVAAGYVAPAPENPDVLAEQVATLAAEKVLVGLREYFNGPELTLEQRHGTLVMELKAGDLLEELDLPFPTGDDWRTELTDLNATDWVLLGRIEGEPGELANWVDKAGGLPPYIKRIEKHLEARGMAKSRAIATAVNVVKKACSTGDLNFPGVQKENAGSQAEACAAVARWESMKKAS
jgi:2'-5' RNA ligase